MGARPILPKALKRKSSIELNEMGSHRSENGKEAQHNIPSFGTETPNEWVTRGLTEPNEPEIGMVVDDPIPEDAICSISKFHSMRM